MRSPTRWALWTVVGIVVVACTSQPQIWVDVDGHEVSTDTLWSWQGDDRHCDWGTATFLQIGWSESLPGVPAEFNDQYVRDPEGIFTDLLTSEYQSVATLPVGARDTGYSHEGRRLWIDVSNADGVFVSADGGIELWPRVEGESPLFCN